ncbi:MAG: hypothetical protein DRO18_03365 [Thermoprotei archaeon]|nr:MAG: hypothetical protein DRO18_03365 [Thermoprotei archaeon]
MSLWHPKRSFPPLPHADTHKDGASDEVIGIAKMGTTLPSAGIEGRFFIKTDTLELYYDNGSSWVKIGKLAGLDLDSHGSRHNYGGEDPITALDASQITSGVLNLDRIPAIPPDKLDAIDSPSDGEVPTYNATEDKFEWKTITAGAAGLDPELDGYIWIHTLFEARSGFSYAEYGSGVVAVESLGARLKTGDTANSYAFMELYREKYITTHTWDKERVMKMAFRYPSQITGDAYSYILMGSESEACIGIWLNEYGSDEVRAYMFDGTTESEEFLTIDTGDLVGSHVLEVKHYPANKAEIYIDGTLQHTFTSNLPSGGGVPARYIFNAKIGNRSDAVNYELYLLELLFVQKP